MISPDVWLLPIVFFFNSFPWFIGHYPYFFGSIVMMSNGTIPIKRVKDPKISGKR